MFGKMLDYQKLTMIVFFGIIIAKNGILKKTVSKIDILFV